MFVKYRGKTKTIYLPVTTSTVITKGDIVSESSGLLIDATSSTTALSHMGVAKKTIASTDSDYATARKIPVEVPIERFVEWKADVTATLVAADIGLEVDLTDAATINRAASTIKVAMVKDVLTTTKGIVWLKVQGNY